MISTHESETPQPTKPLRLDARITEHSQCVFKANLFHLQITQVSTYHLSNAQSELKLDKIQLIMPSSIKTSCWEKRL